MAEERGGLQQSVEFLLNHLIFFFWHLEPHKTGIMYTPMQEKRATISKRYGLISPRETAKLFMTFTQGQIKTRMIGRKVKVAYACASFTLQVCQKMGVEEVDQGRERDNISTQNHFQNCSSLCRFIVLGDSG